MKDAVRDSRPQFVMIDYAALERLPEVGATAFAVYIALVKCAAHESRQCFPARSTLAKTAGISLRSVDTSVVKLCAAGLIAVSRRVADGRDTSNLYTILTVAHRSANSAPSTLQILRPHPANSAHRTRSIELEPEEPDNDQVKVNTPQPPTSPAGNPGDQVAERTVPARGQQSTTPSRAQRSTKTAGSSAPAGGSDAPGGRWAPVAAAIMAAIGRPAPRGKLPSWLGNAVATFGAAAGDDPVAAMVLVAGWTKSRPLREALERGIVRDHTVPAMVGSWIAAGNAGQPPAGVARKADPADRRMRELGAPDNWRELVYTHDGTKRSPVLALPRLGLEPYAPPASWPAWYRAFEGVSA